MKLLITGCAGFVGSHLAEYATAQGAEVWGLRRHFRSLVEALAGVEGLSTRGVAWNRNIEISVYLHRNRCSGRPRGVWRGTRRRETFSKKL